MWEVFTCGKMPYGRLKNTEVVDRVQRGIILERPKACFKEVYEVSGNPTFVCERDSSCITLATGTISKCFRKELFLERVNVAFQVMRKCWCHCPEDRPSFRILKDQLIAVSQGLLAD